MDSLYQRLCWCWVLVGGVLLGPSLAGAVSVTFNPVSQTVEQDETVLVDVVVSDLVAGSAPSVSSFDFEVAYDPSVLTATGVTFGGALGDGFLTSFQGVDLTGAGLVDFAELSFLSDFSSQLDSFTLATLAFDAVASGTSAFSFTQSLLGDAFGGDLNHTSGTGSVTVDEPVVTAPLLSFAPITQTALLGDPLLVDVVISQLAGGGDPSLGTFDLDVLYDPSVLTATGVTFGGDLGDGIFTSLQDLDLSGAGVVDFSELSFLLDFSSQPASFTLGTLAFDTIGLGTSALTFSQALLGDALGSVYEKVALEMGQVTIEDRGMPPVPEPSTMVLFGTGLAALAAWRLRQQQTSCRL